MKKKNGMVGFWAAVSIAAMFFGCILSVTYLNPTNSLSGLLTILATVLVWLLITNHVLNILYKEEKPAKENEEKDAYSSSEAVNVKDDLTAEFRGLVSDLVMLKAESATKLLTYKEADSKDCPKEKLISPEDMENAFWEAANLVSQNCALDRCPCKTNCDKQTLAQKIKNIRKNLKEKSQTP